MSSQAPRPPHPPPVSPAIARVLPMVPEVSLFTHEHVLPSSRNFPPAPSSEWSSHDLLSPDQMQPPQSHLPPPASQVQPICPHLPHPTSQVRPPRPHLPPSHHLLPQSDLSREFHRSEATLFLSGSSDIPVRRVQFQADRADQQHQAGAGQPHHDALHHQQAVDIVGQADRISFPHQVQRLQHHAVHHHDPVQLPQPLDSQDTQHQASVQPHKAVQQINQSHPTPKNTSPPPPPPATHQLPPDIMSVLTWQNDQLAKLREQVARLLAASPQGPVQHAGHLPPGQGGHPPAQTEAGCSPVLKNVSSTSRVTVSTSTSTLFPEIQTPMGRMSEDRQPPPSPQPGACLDLPDYPTTPAGSTLSSQQMRRVGDMNTLDSPVLGESVSMYEGNTSASNTEQEDVEEMYENILGQVKKLLAQDESNQQDRQEVMPPVTTTRQHPIPPILIQDTQLPPSPTFKQTARHPSHQADHPVPAQSATTVTWDRLRQLGVSFISPSDLVQPAPSSSNPYNSFYPLQANIPFSTRVSPSPDTSLAINNMALKYLSDAELGRLAAQHNRQVSTPSSQETRPAEYSLASHQFLARYGLGGEHHGEQQQGVHGQAQEVLNRQNHQVSLRPSNSPHYTPHYPTTSHLPAKPQHYAPDLPTRPQHNTPHLPARPQHSSPHPIPAVQQPARAAAPAMDRVLDITAIRQQSRLW